MDEPAGQNRKPASECIWYVLATVAGEPQSLQDLSNERKRLFLEWLNGFTGCTA